MHPAPRRRQALNERAVWMNWLCVTGVAQVLNRLDGKPFDDADQRLFEVTESNCFPSFCVHGNVELTVAYLFFLFFRHL